MDSNTDGPTPKGNPPLPAALPLPPSAPPLIQPPPAPPPIKATSSGTSSSLRRLVAVLLSLCLLVFLVDAAVSLLDDSLSLLHIHLLGGLRGLVFLLALVGGLGTYLLMGLTPMIPKRVFLPVSLFAPVAGLAVIPFLIYFYQRIQWISCTVSLAQVLVGLLVVYWLRSRRNRLRLFPLVSEQQLNPRVFSWLNLFAFVLINVFLLFPAALIYLFFCASLAVGHLSQGFLSLRPQGFSVQVRKYVRSDGKMIQLVPMAHVGDAQFYHNLTQSFPSNSIILMEGVSDDNNLLTNKVTYQRMAKSLGLAEQHEEFKPAQGEWVRADVDVSEFAPTTIDLLNVVMLVHKQGLSVQTLMPLLLYSPPPAAQDQVWDDLLRKRNRRVLDELQVRLPQSDYLIIPWGAAHMPGISKEIQSSGFQLAEKQDYKVIRFGRRNNELSPKPAPTDRQ